MRELSTPSLFDTPSPIPATAPAEPIERDRAVESEERRSEKLAKDFVRWCFSFGSDFRNSPDLINLRAWTGKLKLKLKDGEENEILVDAKRLHSKRIEQLMKKSDTPSLT